LATLGGKQENKGLGLRFVSVQDNLTVSILGNLSSEGAQVSPGLGVLEVTEVLGPSRLGFSLWSVVRNFLGLDGESEDILHVLLVGGWWVDGTDDGHLTSLGGDGGVELIGDDGNVGLSVVGSQFNLSSWASSVDVGGWGDGNHDWLIATLTDGDTHGELGDKVGLDSGFDLTLDVWDLEGDLGVTLVSSDGIDFSMELGFIATSIKLSLSTEGDHNGETELEAHWETQDGWEVHGLVSQLDGLLVVEWDSTAEGSIVGDGLPAKVFVQVVDLPKALHAVADVDVDGAMGLFLHLTGEDVLQDLLHVLVLLTGFFGAAASKVLGDLVNDLLEGTEVDGGFNWVDTNGTGSEDEEVPEVD
jgi:hypothetical protein